MFPPAVEEGELPLTAFWLLAAIPSAPWFVYAFWIPAWKPPAPPQPATQPPLWSEDRLSPFGSYEPLESQPQPEPTFCLRPWSWSVFERFDTSVVAFDVAFCVAVLGPE